MRGKEREERKGRKEGKGRTNGIEKVLMGNSFVPLFTDACDVLEIRDIEVLEDLHQDLVGETLDEGLRALHKQDKENHEEDTNLLSVFFVPCEGKRKKKKKEKKGEEDERARFS